MGRVDSSKMKASVSWEIKKYDGEKVEGDSLKPVEVITGSQEIPDSVAREILRAQEAPDGTS